MGNSLAIQHEFKNTTIKTPFEKMRARAIITASLDAKGLSLINFNLTAFLPSSKRDDAILILCLWASEPLRKQADKFRAHPEQGKEALNKRIDLLCQNIGQRKDLPNGFLETAQIKMKEAINSDMAYLINSAA
ncbi:MAG: hypothetical protein ACRBDI_09700 [Alphaproteobacteria bacterium]